MSALDEIALNYVEQVGLTMQEYRKDPSRRLSPAVNVHYDSGDTFRVMVDGRCHGCTRDEASAWRIAKQAAAERPFVFVDLLCPELGAA